MARPVTLFTGQWADLPLEELCAKARQFGFDGLELACWGDHFQVDRADDAYCRAKHQLLQRHGLQVHAISNHLVGQAVCDRIDQRHKAILPEHVWGDGDPEGVKRRAAQEMIETAKAAKRFGVKVVNGFTGSSIWHLHYSFPPVPPQMIDEGYADFGRRWKPILDAFSEAGVRFALEVHPAEIAFDIATAERALEAVDNHPAFGFNFDPSHFGYQGVDYLAFIRRFPGRIFHMHVKDVWWSDSPAPSGVFEGHLPFGDLRRYWEFRSPGRGKINFDLVMRSLNAIGYQGPLSVEWEDIGMDREHGAAEACAFVRKIDFKPSEVAFDAAFER
ncbi:MAG TPA: sugar phosphate isomerase/epimerase family protein [Acidobacteriota bacterium]|nr:sugar phosphate isomerase/epimerase family protein [Acidobacteriota bacterium]